MNAPKIYITSLFIVFVLGCDNGKAELSGTDATGPGTQGSSDSTTPGTDSSGDTSSSGDPTENGPSVAEQAAAAACLAHSNTTAIQIPTQENGGSFVFGSLPALFSADSTNASPLWDGYWCHTFSGAEPNPSPRWPVENGWVEEDNQIHVYLVTKGIDDIVYFGTDESQADLPGAPKTAAVHHDMSSVCPELPDVWSPEPAGVAGSQDNARIICMRHTSTVAEVAWVRVP